MCVCIYRVTRKYLNEWTLPRAWVGVAVLEGVAVAEGEEDPVQVGVNVCLVVALCVGVSDGLPNVLPPL